MHCTCEVYIELFCSAGLLLLISQNTFGHVTILYLINNVIRNRPFRVMIKYKFIEFTENVHVVIYIVLTHPPDAYDEAGRQMHQFDQSVFAKEPCRPTLQVQL